MSRAGLHGRVSRTSIVGQLAQEIDRRRSANIDAASRWLSQQFGMRTQAARALIDEEVAAARTLARHGDTLIVKRAGAKPNPTGLAHRASVASRSVSKRPTGKRSKPNPTSTTVCGVAKPHPGKLTKGARAKLPACAFGDPAARKYPIDSPQRAAYAMALAVRHYEQGALGRDEFRRLKARILQAYKRFGIEPGAKVAALNPTTQTPKQETTPMKKKSKGKGKKRTVSAKQRAAAKRNIKKAQAARRKASGATRAAPKKRAAKVTRRTTTKIRRTKLKGGGTRVRTVRTTTTRPNPTVSWGAVFGFFGSAAAGYGVAELIDRYIATSKHKGGKDGQTELPEAHGLEASVRIHQAPPGNMRILAPAGLTALGVAGAFLLRKYPTAQFVTAGAAFGFGLKTVANVMRRWILPALLPVKSQTETTTANRLFPDNWFAGKDNAGYTGTAGALPGGASSELPFAGRPN